MARGEIKAAPRRGTVSFDPPPDRKPVKSVPAPRPRQPVPKAPGKLRARVQPPAPAPRAAIPNLLRVRAPRQRFTSVDPVAPPKKPRAPRKPKAPPTEEVEQDEGEDAGELHSATAAPKKGPPPEVDDSHGDPFVRMLNGNGDVRGVVVGLVLERLCDGYKFIEGEPVIPRIRGNPDVCDQKGQPGWYPKQRNMAKPVTEQDARSVWLGLMEMDAIQFGNQRADLQWGFMPMLRSKVAQGSATSSVMGGP